MDVEDDDLFWLEAEVRRLMAEQQLQAAAEEQEQQQQQELQQHTEEWQWRHRHTQHQHVVGGQDVWLNGEQRQVRSRLTQTVKTPA